MAKYKYKKVKVKMDHLASEIFDRSGSDRLTSEEMTYWIKTILCCKSRSVGAYITSLINAGRIKWIDSNWEIFLSDPSEEENNVGSKVAKKSKSKATKKAST